MIVTAQVTIDGSREAVWAVITDIEHAAQTIRGIESIEVLERPASGLVGLKWRETRILFGKPAAVEKWITAAVALQSYETRAESDGFVFTTTLSLAPDGGGQRLTSAHASSPQTIKARFLARPMLFLFRGVMRRALLQDLDDIKAAVERA